MLEELQAAGAASVLALLRIPGLGPKKAGVLYKELKITTLDELRAACEAHRSASSRASAQRPRRRSWPASAWPTRPTTA